MTHFALSVVTKSRGYSGVENTLYSMENVITIWGNASETVPTITEAC